MLEACRESRHSGKLVEKLVEGIAVQVVFLQQIITVIRVDIIIAIILIGGGGNHGDVDLEKG